MERNGAISRQDQDQEDGDGAENGPSVHGGTGNEVILAPPGKSPLANDVLEDEAHKEPRGNDDARRRRDSRSSCKEEGYVNRPQEASRPSSSCKEDGYRSHTADEHRPVDARVIGALREHSFGSNDAPDDARSVVDGSLRTDEGMSLIWRANVRDAGLHKEGHKDVDNGAPDASDEHDGKGQSRVDLHVVA